MKTKHANTMSGFTLIELLVSLAIVGIIMTSAIPVFAQMIARNQQTAQLHTLFSHHQLARSEAIKTNQRVTLCKSSNGQQCTIESQWHDGWIVFSDTDHNKKINNNERVIFIQQALANNLTLKYKGFGSHNYISYFSDGRSSTNGTFTLCTQFKDETARSIIISRTGRARLDNKGSDGGTLECS
ncbi:MAG: GspH/FimT family pseudopilin [Gammaproteobacteria bacterium]|nr:GspH/FimT family pseudopilin [Gammaproteobacteria bacterium]